MATPKRPSAKVSLYMPEISGVNLSSAEESSQTPLMPTDALEPSSKGLGVTIFMVAPMPPEGTSAREVLYTSTACTPSEDRFEKAKERDPAAKGAQKGAPGSCRPVRG